MASAQFVTAGQMKTRILALLGDTSSSLTSSDIDPILDDTVREWQAHSNPIVDYNQPFGGLHHANWLGDFITTYADEVSEILSMHRSASTVVSATLEYLPPHEIHNLYNESTTSGTAKYWSIDQSDKANLKRYLYPPPSSDQYVSAVLKFQHHTLIGNNTYIVKLLNDEAYMVARVVAARIAHMMNRSPELIKDLWRGVPEHMQAILRDEMPYART